MSAIETEARDNQREFLQRLHRRIDKLTAQLRNRRAQGWDQGSFQVIANEVERIHNATSKAAESWVGAIATLRGPLTAARQAARLPDPAATSHLVATAEQLLCRLAADMGADETSGRPAPKRRVRSPPPPPQEWRHWAEDPAAPPTPPNSDTHAMVPADSSPSTLQAARPTDEAPYRVLIVEDDRSQALFAEGVLHGAGIESVVASNPGDVLETMTRVRPDLVLMDLHMPGLSGTELTARIREQQAFLHTPIVFLTGDPDPEKQFEVLEVGADDFLQKPIRPRHLVAAVQSRLMRARVLGRQRMTDAHRHPVTGLMTRTHLLQRLDAHAPVAHRGGVFFVEVEGTAVLRQRYGYAALETLMSEAGRHLGTLAGANPAARLSDNGFLVFAPELEASQLADRGRALRDGMSRHAFELEGGSLRLRASVGFASLRHGFADAGAAVEAAEQAVRLARTDPIGLAEFVPPERPDHGELGAELRAALATGRFELAYQPIVAVAGGQEAQYQTLLRLRTEDGTLRTAAELVPAAEAAGLIHDVDRWVLERALDVLQQRRAQSRPVRLFVSQSPHTLARDGYAEWVAQAIQERGLEGPSLVVDVRLSEALIHSVTMRQFCEQLVPVGVQFCLSQYEHGADADTLLSQLPLGCLRLSARYADGAGTPEIRDEMRVAIERAHRLGLQVVGHRVEDPQAAATLWMGGIDYIQGNLVQQAAGELDFDFQHAIL